MRKLLYSLYFSIALFLVYNIWSRTGRDYTYKCVYHVTTQTFGENQGKGNLLGIQPYFTPFDFSRPSAYYDIFNYHFQQAQKAGLLNDKTVVVLPEYIGTWLVVAGEKNAVFTDQSIPHAMRTVVLSNIGGFVLRYFQAQSDDRSKEAILRMKARYMKNIYEKTFSELAKKYKVTIVAGSIVLPNPHIVNGELKLNTKGKLYNVSCVFDPDGDIQSPLVVKQFPIAEEKIFTACMTGAAPVFQTPAGKLGVLICADSWYPAVYKDLAGINMLAVPSYVSPQDAWQKKWMGYSGAPAPADIDKNDIGTISEKDAWLKYAMCSRAPKADIQNGIHVFLRGELWDVGSDGNALLTSDTTVWQAEHQKQHVGQIINLWLQ